jgi:hypothetical protein
VASGQPVPFLKTLNTLDFAIRAQFPDSRFDWERLTRFSTLFEFWGIRRLGRMAVQELSGCFAAGIDLPVDQQATCI